MDNLLAIILISKNNADISKTLYSIKKQDFKNWGIYILSTDTLKISDFKSSDKIKLIKLSPLISIFNQILDFTATLNCEYISIINSGDINTSDRYETQISYLNKKNLNICSCLELPIDNDIKSINLLNEANKLTNSTDINNAIKGSYLSLDVYTFLFRKSFLSKINKYSKYFNLNTELDLILFLLRYENISKINKVLYYVKNLTLPYEESIHYDKTINTKNKLALFNINNILEKQNYLNDIINLDISIDATSSIYYGTIVIFLDTVEIGGTENYVISLSRALKKKNINTCIITNKCFSKELFILFNIKIYEGNLNSKEFLINTLKKIDNIKLIQIHMEPDIHLAPLIKRICKIPIMLIIHGIYYSSSLLKNYIKYVNSVVFVSDSVKLYYKDLLNLNTHTKFITIPNGIDIEKNYKSKFDLRKKLGIPNNSLIFVYCSRLSDSKAPLALIFLKAFLNLAYKNKNIYCIIIGDGTKKFILDSIVNKYNNELTSKRIFMIGYKFDVLSYYKESNFVVGTGRVALESMSLGKVVVSFGLNGDVNIINSGNITKLISTNFGDHSPTKTSIDQKESLKTLTNALKFLLKNPSICKKIGIWNMNYVQKNLSLDNIISFIKQQF